MADRPDGTTARLPACPICAGPGRCWRKIRGYDQHVCVDCGHWFVRVPDGKTHLETVYGDTYFAGDPGGYVDYLGEERQQQRTGAYYARLLVDEGFRPGSCLDVGCAAGFQAEVLARSGWQVDGIEPNAAMANEARARGIHVAGNDVGTWTPTKAYRAILMLQVISHLRDPARAVAMAAEALEPGGCLLVETWDRTSWAARLQGTGWHELNPPSVLHWFSRRSLADLLRQNGLEPARSGLPPKHIAVGRGLQMLGHSAGRRGWMKLATAPLALLPRSLSVPYLVGDAFWVMARKKVTAK